MPYVSESIRKFTSDLSAKLPAPGGGAAAALVGAVSASLNCMVGNFTAGNEKYADAEAEIRELLKKSEEVREELLKLLEEDILAYGNYSKASKLPKITEVEKQVRAKALEAALLDAATVPFNIMLCCYNVLQACKPLAEKGNKNLLSDVGVAAYFAKAALKAAYLNVIVNFLYLKEEAFKCKILKETEILLKNADIIEGLIEDACYKNLKK